MATFNIKQLQVDLHTKKASVSLMEPDTNVVIQVVNFDFDETGDQTESQLRELVLSAVRRLLQRAAEADFSEG